MNPMTQESLKKLVAYSSLQFISDGMIVGLGTGSTAKFVVEGIIERGFQITGVPTSSKTRELAASFGILLKSVDEIEAIDVAIDGADQIDLQSGICLKGGGGAHYIEKKVAKKSSKFVVIVDESKVVENFKGCKVALEVDKNFKGLEVVFREGRSDSGNLIADIVFDGSSIVEFEKMLMTVPGVIDTGIFIGLVDTLLIGCEDGTVKTYNYAQS